MARRAELTVEDGVARLRLVHAAARNAIDPQMVSALGEAVAACAAESGVRALLISADGPAFTVGGDLRHFASDLERLPQELDQMIGDYHEALRRLAELAAPVVCAVQGGVAGGGLGLLWCADLVIAADDLKLAAGFARLGLTGDGGSSWWLPRLIGLPRARELLIGGRVLNADEALEWGLIGRVVPAGELQAEARAVARELAAGATVAYAELRRLLTGAGARTLAEGLAGEHEAMVRIGGTSDAREGIAAFVEHRPPRFEGR